MHVSDLHFGRPAVAEQVEALRRAVQEIEPDAVAVSGDLTQRCADAEFARAREFLESVEETAPTVVVPGNHDVRWMLAGPDDSERAREFKYSRYRRHISEDLNPSLEIPGAVLAGLNTARGISREALTPRFWDLGVIGHVGGEALAAAREAFERANPAAARIIVAHHNPVQGPVTGRHGLANAGEALEAFAELGVEIVLCGHDHHDAIHSVETAPGLLISAAGTISSRVRGGRPSSFNVVEIAGESIKITTFTWEKPGSFRATAEQSLGRNGAVKK